MGAYLRVGAYSMGRLLDIPVSSVGAYSREGAHSKHCGSDTFLEELLGASRKYVRSKTAIFLPSPLLPSAPQAYVLTYARTQLSNPFPKRENHIMHSFLPFNFVCCVHTIDYQRLPRLHLLKHRIVKHQ